MKTPSEVLVSLEDSIGFCLNITYRTMRKRLVKRLSAEGLEYSSWFILRILWENEGCTQKDICKITESSQPSVTSALNRMKAQGLVRIEADDKDRRQTYIYLTDKARDLKTRMLAQNQIYAEKALVGIEPEKVAELREILRKIRKNCEVDI